MTIHEVDVCVVGAGQSGLALGYHLQRLARRAAQDSRTPLSVVLLDERDAPGGAWCEGWDTLSLFSPATYSSLPGWPMPPWRHPGTPSAEHVVRYLADYEKRYDLPVRRPVQVVSVQQAADDRLLVHTDGDTWSAAVVVNATGTWSRPFWPTVPGGSAFTGAQLHTVDYRSGAEIAGPRVLVVGGGNSGAQIAADLLLHSEHQVTWCTREPPTYLPDDVDGRVLFESATRAVQALAAGVEGVAGLGDIVAVPSVRQARDEHGLRAVEMFQTLTPDGALWADGTHRSVDTVIWCTGFRPALAHLRDLPLPRVDGHPGTEDPRLLFLGYGDWCGPASATLIGVNRTARAMAASITAYVRSR